MTARILKNRTALSSVLVELRYSLSRLQATPLTASLVPAFQTRRDEWKTINDEEITILEATSDAQARVDAADDGLDAFSSKLSKAILTITRDDRAHPLYLHFFGTKTLGEFIKPVCRGQLDAMKKWPASLAQSPFATLQALAPELGTCIADADAAVAARDIALQNKRLFRDIGARKLFLDRVNATRKTAHGELTKLAIETPGLPTDFADDFFRKVVDDEEDAPTIASVTSRIATLETEVTEQKAILAELTMEAEAAAKVAQDQLALAAELADLEKQSDEIEKQKAELKKKLDKK